MSSIERFEEIEAWQMARELTQLEQYITQEEFKQLYNLAKNTRGKIKAFMNYLKSYAQRRDN